jgi:sugar lactone lactonase YvrE
MGTDGAAYLAHTGGRIGTFWVAEDTVDACVQRLEPGSDQPTTLLTEVEGTPLIAPHDICWGADGRLWLTDSHIWQWEEADRTGSGRIIALAADGRAQVVVDTGVTFPCGIVGAADGSIYWTESYRDRVRRRTPDGRIETYHQLPEGHTPHGLRFAADGSLWVASFGSSTIDVIAPGGGSARHLHTGSGSHPMNLAFDGATLYAVDFQDSAIAGEEEMDGRLWRLDAGVPGAQAVRSAFPAAR